MVGSENVFKNRHGGEEADVLEGSGNAEPGNLVRPLSGDILAQERNGTGGGRIDAGDRIEGRRLSGTVGANQGHDFPLVDEHGEIIDRHDAAELHGEMLNIEDVLAHAFSPPFFLSVCRFRNRSGSSRVPMMP